LVSQSKKIINHFCPCFIRGKNTSIHLKYLSAEGGKKKKQNFIRYFKRISDKITSKKIYFN